MVSLILIHWIVISQVGCAIHLLNNLVQNMISSIRLKKNSWQKLLSNLCFYISSSSTKERVMEDASNKNPRQTAGFISLLTFSWLGDILKLGSKHPLEEKHLFPLERSFQAKDLVDFLEREWSAEVRWSQQTRTKPRLWRAMLRIIPYREYIILALLRIFYSLSMNLLPLMVWLFLKSISSGSSEISYASSLPFVVCISVTSVARNMFGMHGVFKGEMCSIRFKVAVVGLVYKKVFIFMKYD